MPPAKKKAGDHAPFRSPPSAKHKTSYVHLRHHVLSSDIYPPLPPLGGFSAPFRAPLSALSPPSPPWGQTKRSSARHAGQIIARFCPFLSARLCFSSVRGLVRHRLRLHVPGHALRLHSARLRSTLPPPPKNPSAPLGLPLLAPRGALLPARQASLAAHRRPLSR